MECKRSFEESYYRSNNQKITQPRPNNFKQKKKTAHKLLRSQCTISDYSWKEEPGRMEGLIMNCLKYGFEASSYFVYSVTLPHFVCLIR